MITSRNSEECDLRIEAQRVRRAIREGAAGRSPWMARNEEPQCALWFNGAHQTVEGQTIVNLIERIVHNQLVIGVVVGGPRFDGSETLVDLGNPHSLREELTGPVFIGSTRGRLVGRFRRIAKCQRRTWVEGE